MGRYDYFGQGDAHPRVYEMEPLEGLEHVETGATVQRARVKREVPFKLPNGKGYEQDEGYYPWGGGEASRKPSVLEPERHTATAGMIDLYHHTSPESAASIVRSKQFQPEPDGPGRDPDDFDARVYFSDQPHSGQAHREHG